MMIIYYADKVQIMITCGCVAVGISGLCIDSSNPCTISSAECVRSVSRNMIISFHGNHLVKHTLLSLSVAFNRNLPSTHGVRLERHQTSSPLHF